MYNLIVNNLYIFDPTEKDPLSKFRGGGRIIQILKENFPKAKFIDNLNQLFNYHLDNGRDRVGNVVFLNPIFNPFQPPITLKRLTKKQIQIIFDVIPLKYPSHFPIGLRGKFNLWLNKKALKNYDKIITISHHSKKDIIRHLKIPEEKIEVIYPTLGKIFLNPNNQAPDPKESTKPQASITKKIQNFNEQNSNKKENSKSLEFRNSNLFGTSDLGFRNFCLYVGDVNWNKNLVNLAKAIKIINVTCVFVGKAFEIINPKSEIRNPKQIPNSNVQNSKPKNFGAWDLEFGNSKLNHPWQKEFRDFLKEVNGDKRFIFLGYIDDYRLIKFYQQARLNILISRDEGFGFSYLEAASCGCPSVLSDIGVFHEIAGDCAWFANPNDPYDIANKIGEIYFNKKLRDELGFKAWKRARFFNQELFKKKLFENLKMI